MVTIRRKKHDKPSSSDQVSKLGPHPFAGSAWLSVYWILEPDVFDGVQRLASRPVERRVAPALTVLWVSAGTASITLA